MIPEANIAKEAEIEDVPKGAQYALLNPAGEFIQAFIRFVDIKYPDGTVENRLQFWSHFENWVNSVVIADWLKPENKYIRIISKQL